MKKQRRTVSTSFNTHSKNNSFIGLQTRHSNLNDSLRNGSLIQPKKPSQAKSTSRGCNSKNKQTSRIEKSISKVDNKKIVKQLQQLNPNSMTNMKILGNKKTLDIGSLGLSNEIYSNINGVGSGRNLGMKRSEVILKQKNKKSHKNKIKSSRINNQQNSNRQFFQTQRYPKIAQNCQVKTNIQSQSKEDALKQLKRRNEELQQKLLYINNNNSQIDKKEIELLKTSCKRQIQKKQGQIKQLNKKLSEIKEQKEAIQKQKKQVLQKVHALEQLNIQKQDKMDKIRQDKNKQIQANFNQIKQLQMEKMQNLMDIQTQKRKIMQLQNQFNQIQQRNTNYQKHIQSIQNDLLNLKSQMNSIISQNLALKQTNQKYIQQNQYLKTHLYSVLGAIRNNLKFYQQIKDKANLSAHQFAGKNLLSTVQ